MDEHETSGLLTAAKRALLHVLRAPGVVKPFAPLTRGCAAVFMLHRFHHDDLGVVGHDPKLLRQTLEHLRRHRYDIVDVSELVRRLRGEGHPLHRTVAFTMDDGYRDQAEIAAPVFAEYDCPVTTFVTTGFLDRDIWLWWDQIEFIFSGLERDELSLSLADSELSYHCTGTDGRRRAVIDFSGRCKEVSDAERRAAIAALAEAAGVDLPIEPPERYAPMTWDQLRKCESRGMTFGPHSVTHPILSRASTEQARKEIIESRDRLSRGAADPVPVFCYPNGQWDDFGRREMDILLEQGFLGAFAAVSGYADAANVQRQPSGQFMMRRFSYPDSLPTLIQVVSGVERFKQILRREK